MRRRCNWTKTIYTTSNRSPEKVKYYSIMTNDKFRSRVGSIAGRRRFSLRETCAVCDCRCREADVRMGNKSNALDARD